MPDDDWDEHEELRKALHEGLLYKVHDVPYDVLVFEIRRRDKAFYHEIKFPLSAAALLIFLVGMLAGWWAFGS